MARVDVGIDSVKSGAPQVVSLAVARTNGNAVGAHGGPSLASAIAEIPTQSVSKDAVVLRIAPCIRSAASRSRAPGVVPTRGSLTTYTPNCRRATTSKSSESQHGKQGSVLHAHHRYKRHAKPWFPALACDTAQRRSISLAHWWGSAPYREEHRGWQLSYLRASRQLYGVTCHSGPAFSDGRFHATGVVNPSVTPDFGRSDITNRRGDIAAFKTPPLRDLVRRGAHLTHDGGFDLRAVLDNYNTGGTHAPRDREMVALELDAQELDDLEAFLLGGLASSSYPNVTSPWDETLADCL